MYVALYTWAASVTKTRNAEVKRHKENKPSQAFACTHSMSLTFVSLNVGVLRGRDDQINLLCHSAFKPHNNFMHSSNSAKQISYV